MSNPELCDWLPRGLHRQVRREGPRNLFQWQIFESASCRLSPRRCQAMLLCDVRAEEGTVHLDYGSHNASKGLIALCYDLHFITRERYTRCSPHCRARGCPSLPDEEEAGSKKRKAGET